MATHAWPYAVSRDQQSGYQAFVVPEFMADAGQAYILEYASKGETSQPDTVTVREVRGAVTQPLSLAYRVTETPTGRGEPSGQEMPRYRASRTVRLFEGLVLQMPAEQVASLGLTAADLDAVASVTAPTFHKLRAAETRAEAEPSTAISIANPVHGAQLLDLQIVKPCVVPRPGDRQAKPAEARSGRDLIVATIIVGALAALLVWYLIWLMPR